MMTGAIFDADGTLLDSMQVWDHAGERYLSGLGITPGAGLGKALFPMTMEAGAEYIKRQYHLSGPREEIIRGINHTVEEAYFHEVSLKPGAAAFLEGLKAEGAAMCIATSSDRYVIEAALRRLEVLDYFTEIYTCSECGAGKERPDIYGLAARGMGADQAGVWVFEDAVHALRTARAAGFKTVGVYDESSRDRQEELEESCDIYLKDFDDFPGFIEKVRRTG